MVKHKYNFTFTNGSNLTAAVSVITFGTMGLYLLQTNKTNEICKYAYSDV
jgi:hypothetical protein